MQANLLTLEAETLQRDLNGLDVRLSLPFPNQRNGPRIIDARPMVRDQERDACWLVAIPSMRPRDMVTKVKLTLDVDASIVQSLREEATQRGTTMSAVVVVGLRSILANSRADEDQPGDLPPLPSWNSGGFLVDISNRDELYRVMAGE